MADEKKKEGKEQKQPETGGIVAPEGDQPPAQQTAGRQIRLSLAGVQPDYANFCTVALGQDEVFFNFAKVFGISDEVKVDSQIFMSVRNAKRLSIILQRLIEQYEAKNGVLEIRV